MEWLLFAVLAMFLFGAANFLLKLSTLKGFDLAHLENVFKPELSAVLVPALILPILGSVALMTAFRQPGAEGKTGVIVAIASLSVVVVTLASVLMLGEQYTARQVAGILLALVAIGLLVI